MKRSKPSGKCSSLRLEELESLLDSPEKIDQMMMMLDQEYCSRSLLNFIKVLWNVVEPTPFVDGWHIGAICEHLMAVSYGQIKRLIMNIPPRHMKSLGFAVFWPAWDWAYINSGRRFLFNSYAQNLSTRDSIKCRAIINHPAYQRIARNKFKLSGDQNAKMRFENDKGGYRIASSVGGTNTGEGGDFLCVDDPHNVTEVESETQRLNVTEEWWDTAMSTRLNDPEESAIVITMQRVHSKDLTGHVLEQSKRTGENWTHLCLPARYEGTSRIISPLLINDKRCQMNEPLWPEKFSDKSLKVLEQKLLVYGTASQLQQRPSPREGGIIKPHWFKLIDRTPPGWEFVMSMRFWDLASTEKMADNDPDFTAGSRLDKFYCKSDDLFYYTITHVNSFRETPGGTERNIEQQSKLDGDDVYIRMEQEGGASGKIATHSYRKLLQAYSFKGVPSTGNKEHYITIFAAAAEAGYIYILNGSWNIQQFLDQCAAFPKGAHDDEIDSAAKCYCLLAKSSPSIRSATDDNEEEDKTVEDEAEEKEVPVDPWLMAEDLD